MLKKRNNDIGNRIAQLRREKNLTQEDLANLLFITPQAVSKWERGTGLPDLSIIPALADALGVSVGSLFGELENNSQNTSAVPTFNSLPLVAQSGNIACYSNKNLLSENENEVLFTDGSIANYSTKTVTNKGLGEIRLIELEHDYLDLVPVCTATKLENKFDNFKSIDLSISYPCNVEIERSDDFNGIIAEGSALFIHQIETSISDGILNINVKSTKSGTNRENNKLTVLIPHECNELLRVKIAGSSNVISSSDFYITELEISGSGDIRAGNCGNLATTIAGSGDIFFGNVKEWSQINIFGAGDMFGGSLGDRSTVSIYGSGDVRFAEGKNVTVNIQGAGDASIGQVSEDFSATITGSGDVSCNGMVNRLAVTISGTGSFDGSGVTANQAAITIIGTGDVSLDRIIESSTEILSKSANFTVKQRG